MMKKPVVWTIAGSDPSGGAGLQADLHTFQALGAHGCSVITTVTAQNSTEVSQVHCLTQDVIQAQLNALAEDMPAQIIKLGLLGNLDIIQQVYIFLKNYPAKVVLDPVMVATVGTSLTRTHPSAYRNALLKLLPLVEIITPNLSEAEALTDLKVIDADTLEQAAEILLSHGVKNVLIKGGHQQDNFCQDYWSDGKTSFWLANERIGTKHYHGTGCVLSSAIAASLALGYELKDALVISKMYVNQSIHQAMQPGKGVAYLSHSQWPNQQINLPYLSKTKLNDLAKPFPTCQQSLGLYPIVDRAAWLTKLVPHGVQTMQLRIKDLQGNRLEVEIKESIQIAKQFGVQLFINDYWELALQHQAYGVHLGQSDIDKANIGKIRDAGLRLGISTHSYYEVARAHALQPSYIAFGPIYSTTSKVMPFEPQGVEMLNYWCQLLNYPVVAIGGINAERLPLIRTAGADGAAMISAITQARDSKAELKNLLTLWSNPSSR